MKVLVTGAAGFIGYHTTLRLLERGDEVVGIDNINDYYDVRLKYGRLNECGIPPDKASQWNSDVRSDQYPDYRFLRLDLADREHIAELFAREKFQRVVHLGAQAGIRYSLVNSSPVRLMDFIEAIEDALQKGDVPATCRHLRLGEDLRIQTRHPPSRKGSAASWSGIEDSTGNN